MKKYFLLIIVLFAIFISSCREESGNNNTETTNPISNQGIPVESTYDIAELPIHEETQPTDIKTAQFDFDIEIADLRLKKAEELYFSDVDLLELNVKVTTTCVSGEYKYTSTVSPGFDGGIPVLLLPDGTEFEHDPNVYGMGFENVDIKKGDVTYNSWTFYLPADFASGEYDIRVDCDNGQTKLFENVLIEFKE